MSVEHVKAQIKLFLDSERAEVLCIRGNWGTGKTYNWDQTLKEAATNKMIGPDKYSYVSLFGLNSLDDLKKEIIHRTINVDQVGKEFNFQDVESYVKSAHSGIFKVGGFLARRLGGDYISVGAAFMYMLVRNRLICIDDLERKGANLPTADVLGLVSQLREGQNCKVVILLNDERLEDRAKFESYLEKVVDINLRFSPTAMESAEIALKALGGTREMKELVRERTTKLGIDNVRVIRKLYSFVQQIEPLLTRYKADVFHSVAHTIVLMGWCHLQPEFAPSKQYLVRRNNAFAALLSDDEDEISPQEQEWEKIITGYGYSHTDEFDLALLKGIEEGFFTKESIDQHAADLDQRVEVGLASEQLNQAWSKFHDSFENDLEEVLRGFKSVVTENAKLYSLRDVIAVVELFRALDRKDAGDKLLDVYLGARRGVDGTYDFDDVQLYGARMPDDIQEKIVALTEQSKRSPPVLELFLMLADDGSNENITKPLAALSVDEYVQALKHYQGTDSQKLRRALTQYYNLVNPDVYKIEIMKKANQALQQIARENRLNETRVKAWRIGSNLEGTPSAAAQAAIGEAEATK